MTNCIQEQGSFQTGIRQRSLRKHCRMGRATELVFVLATGTVIMLASEMQAQSTNWTGAVDGSYVNPLNWDNGLPLLTGTAVFDGTPTTTTVDLGALPQVVGNVTVSSSTLTSISNGMLTFDPVAPSLLSYAVPTSANVLADTLSLNLNGADLNIEAATDLAFAGDIVNLGLQGGTLDLQSADGAELTISGDIVETLLGQISVNVSGGNVTLSGINDFTGGTTVTAGQLSVTAGIGSGTVSVDTNGTFALLGDRTVGTISGTGTVNLNANTLTLSAAGDGTFDGTLSGTGLLEQAAAGTLTLTGDNSGFTGDIGVRASGVVAAATDAALGAGTIDLDDGTLNLTASTTISNALTVGAGGGIVSSADGLAITLSGDVAAVGALSFGDGVNETEFTLTGDALTTGVTVAQEGTLILGSEVSANVLSNGVAVTGELDLNGYDAATAVLSGAGQITSNNTNDATLTVSGASAFNGQLTDGIGGTLGVRVDAGSGNAVTLTAATGGSENTYSGDTAVDSGTLIVNAGGGIGDTSAVSVAGALQVDADETIASLAGDGDVALNASTLTIAGNTTTEFSGDVAGTGGLTLNSADGTGQLTLSGANSFTGATTVTSGTLTLQTATALAAGADVAVGQNGVLDVNAGSLGVINSAGVLTLDGASTTSLNLTGGSATLGAGSSVTGGSTVADATLIQTAGAAGDITLGTGGIFNGSGGTAATVTADDDTSDVNLSGDISVAALDLNAGSGHSVAGTATVSGATTVNDATLSVQGDGLNTLDVGANGIVNVDADSAVNTLSGVGAVNVGANILTVAGADAAIFGGVLSGSGALSLGGTSDLTLAGDNSAFTGATELGAGTVLRALGGNALGNTSAVTVAGSGVLELDSSETIGSLAGAGTVQLGANTLTVAGNQSTTFGGALEGVGGALTLDSGDGTGSLTLSGINSFTGLVDLASGTLVTSTVSALANTTALTIGTAGTLDLQADLTIGSLAGVGGGVLQFNGNALQLTGATDTTFGGTLNGAGALVNSGGSTLSLTGDNTGFIGDITVRGDSAVAGATNAFGSGAVTLDGGSLLVTGDGTLENAITANAASANTLSAVSGSSLTLNGLIDGAGALTFGDGAVSTFTVNNGLVTGTTGVSNNATLILGAAAGAGVIGGTGLTLDGTVDLNGNDAAVGAVTGAGVFTSNNAADVTLTFNGTAGFGGAVQDGTGGTVGVIIDPAGTGNQFSFANAQTYTGGTTVQNGTLSLTAANALADSGAVTLATGGTLSLDAGDETISSLSIAGGVLDLDTASLNVQGAVVNQGTGASAGSIIIADGEALTAASLTNSGDATLSNAGTLQSTLGIEGGTVTNTATGSIGTLGTSADVALTGGTLINSGTVFGSVTTAAGAMGGQIDNAGGTITGNVVSESAEAITNANGNIGGTATVAGDLNNTSGTIAGVLTSTAGIVTNTDGAINAGGLATDTNSVAGDVTNGGSGVITGNLNFDTAAALDNAGSVTGNVVNADAITNTGSLGSNTDNVHTAVGAVANSGTINGDLTITAGGLTSNAGGVITGDLAVTGNSDNTNGNIGGTATVAGDLNNTSGTIAGVLTSMAGSVTNTDGAINAGGSATDTNSVAGDVTNGGSGVIAGNLNFDTAAALDNAGSVTGNVVNADAITNTGSLGSNTDNAHTAVGAVANSGTINGDLTITAGGLTSNAGGVITGDLAVTGNSDNTGGSITGSLTNNGGTFVHGFGDIGGEIIINDGTVVVDSAFITPTTLNDTVTVAGGANATLELTGGRTIITGDLHNSGTVRATGISELNVDGTADDGQFFNNGLLTTSGLGFLTITADTVVLGADSHTTSNVLFEADSITNAGTFEIAGDQVSPILNTGDLTVVGPTNMAGDDIRNDNTFTVSADTALTGVRAFDNNAGLTLLDGASIVVDGSNPPTSFLPDLQTGEFANDGTTILATGASITAQSISNNAGSISLGTDAILTATAGSITNAADLDVDDGAAITATAGITNTGADGIITFEGDATLNADSDNSGDALVNSGTITTVGNSSTVTLGDGTADLLNNIAGGTISIGEGDTFGGRALSVANAGEGARIEIGSGATLLVSALDNGAGGTISNAGTITPTVTVENDTAGMFDNLANGQAGNLSNSGTATNEGTLAAVTTASNGSFTATGTSTQSNVTNAGTTSLLGGTAANVIQDTGATGTLSIGTAGTDFALSGTLTANDMTTTLGTNASVAGLTTVGDSLGAANSAVVTSRGALDGGATVNADGQLNIAGGTAASLLVTAGTATVGEDGTITGLTTVGDGTGAVGSAQFSSAGSLQNIAVDADGAAVLTAGTAATVTVDAGTLSNAGTVGNATASNGGQITNEAGGTISGSLTNMGGIISVAGGSVAALDNTSGTATVTAGAVTTFNNAATASNAGTVATLNQTAGAFDNRGEITTATVTGGTFGSTGNIGTLDHAGGISTVQGGTVNAATNTGGTLDITGGSVGTLTSSATTTNRATVQSVAITGGTFDTSGTITSGTVISDGTVTNSGTMGGVTIAGGSFTNQAGVAGGVVNNGGTVDISGGNAGAVQNNTGSLTIASAGQAASVTNAATAVNAGTVASLTNTSGSFDNTGAITGGVALAGGSITNSGDIGSLSVTGGTFDSTAGAVGDVVNTGGSLNFAGGTVGAVDNTSGSVLLDASAASVINRDSLVISAVGSVTGDVTTQAGSTSDINGTIGGTLISAGTDAVNATVDGIIDNLSAGVLTVDGDTVTQGVLQGGTLVVDSGATLIGDVQTLEGSTTDLNGTIAGDVVNTGALSGTGRVAGILINDGGALSFDGLFTVDTALVSVGTLVQGAGSVLTADLFHAGLGVADVNGRLVGTLSNTGTLEFSGLVTGDLINTETGVVTVDGDATVEGVLTNAARFTLADGSSIDLNGGQFLNDGTLTSTGTIIGDLVQNQTAQIAGVVQGDIITAAQSGTTVTGDLSAAALANGGTLDLASGTTTVTSAENTGSLTVAQDAALTGQSILQSGAQSTLDIAGTVDSDVTANGTTALTGRVTGDLVTAGTAALGGTIAGALDNTGTADVVADLEVGGAVTTSGSMTVAETATLTALAGTTNTGALVISGALTGDLANTGDAAVTGAVDGAVENAGALTLAGDISGPLNGAAGSTTTVAGETQVDGLVTDAGTFTVLEAGELEATAGVALSGSASVAGLVTADVSVRSAGDLDLTEGGRIAGDLINRGETDVAGTVTGDVVNSGTLGVAETGQLAETLTTSGTAVVNGSVAGAVENTGMLEVGDSGILAQDLENSGTAEIAGLVSGAISNSGTVTVTETGTLIGRLEQADGATAQISGTIGGLDVAEGVATLGTTGVVAGTTQISDLGTVVSNGALFGQSVTNAGRLNITDTTRITGDLTNNGVLDGTTTAGDLALTVSGVFTNNDTVSNAGTTGQFNVSASSIVLGATSQIIGAVNLIGDTENNGSIVFDGSSTQDGMLNNSETGTIEATTAVDFAGNALDNDGSVNVGAGGAINNLSSLANSGVIDIAEGGSVQAALTTNEAQGVLNNSGTLSSDLVNMSGATASSTGVLIGNVTNADGGLLSLGGTVDGSVVNSGQLSGGAVITGILQTTQSGVTTVDGVLSADQTQIIGGDLIVTQAGTLATANDVMVSAGGTLASLGTINSGVVVSAGSTINSIGEIIGDLDNSGQADLAGTIGGDIVNAGSGTVQVTGDLATQGAANAGNLSVLEGATLTAAEGIASSGALDVSGEIVGDVASNAGSVLDIAGRVTGDVATAGQTTLGGVIDGALASTGTSVTATGAASAITGSASFADTDLIVNEGASLAMDGGATLDNASSLVALGDVAGDITSSGSVSLAQGLDGSLTSSGVAVIAGTIADDLTITAGSLDLQGDVTVGDNFATVLDLDIAEGQTITATQFDFDGEVLNVDGNLDAFTLLGETAQDPATSVLNLSSGASVGGLRSFGTLNATGDTLIDGDFESNGIIDLTGNATPGDRLTINGDFSGDTALFVDVDLGASTGSSDGQSDTLAVTGAATGHFDVRLDASSFTIGEQDNDIVIVDVDSARASDSTYTFTLTNAADIPVSERIVFSLARNTDAGSLNFGDLVLVDQVNPAIGALAGNVSLSQSLIGSVVNRPTSPFVVPAASGDACGAGSWTRATGGRATASGNTEGSLSTLRSEIEATYYGLQIGGDFGCYQGAFNGFDLTFGGLGGYNRGNGTQPVFAIDPTDPTRLTGVRTSVTKSEFDQVYGGAYVIAAKDRFSADLQINVGKTDFVLNNRSDGGNTAGLGLTDAKFDITTTTISGALSYGFSLPVEGVSFTPTLGFALSKSKTSTIRFDDGSKLEVDDSDTQVGFVGGTLSRVKVAETGQSALAYFGTATVYKDFSDGLESTFTLQGENGGADLVENLTSENLGLYGELSLGINYTKILRKNDAGVPIRQLSASARADFRYSDTLDSAAITAQLRFQF